MVTLTAAPDWVAVALQIWVMACEPGQEKLTFQPDVAALPRPAPAQAAVEALFAQFSPVVTAAGRAGGRAGRAAGGSGPGV